ncbi:hypothetical protein [Klenkia taihuensis]|uniref:Uncharacterized protein n=1 Tax=Klenkia taihuensis TaxID=1225127 RepID=A0A1I1IU64_9ACTN|nr:hypothetical protein [Klenkia taihuensis]GHE11286.1 hypothetical protein GCM10011381_24180 [Klenkia taihuensis]SFC39262.1 hypothetical protein SAMN05661030_0855 [Klenkia taihuensis]
MTEDPADGQRADAEEFLARRPFGRFLVVQLAWGCLGALVGVLLSGWVLAVVLFVVFAGSGLVGREVVRRRHGRGRGR